MDVPHIESILLQLSRPERTVRCQRRGEPPIVPVAGVIASAVSDAIGRPIERLPITPFDVLAALRGRRRDGR